MTLPTIKVPLTEEIYDIEAELAQLQEVLMTPDLPDEYIDCVAARIDWLSKARPAQLPPEGTYSKFLLLAGRGFGKTLSCAQDNFWFATRHPGVRIGIVAPTLNDLRKTCFEGDSGLLGVIPPSLKKKAGYKYNRALFELQLPNGSKFEGFASEAYERLRGPQFHRMWFEELCAWKNIGDTYKQAMFTLRLKKDANGEEVQNVAVISTTPKPLRLLKELVMDKDTVITSGRTIDNAENLGAAMIDEINKLKLTDPDLYKQEAEAEILDFSGRVPIQRKNWRLWDRPNVPLPEKVVISLDTAFKDNKDSDSTACTVWAVCRVSERYELDHPVIKNAKIYKSRKEWAIILVEAWKEKLLYPDMKEKVLGTYAKWVKKLQARLEADSMRDDGDEPPAVDVLIEDKASGTALLQEFARAGMPVIPYNPMNKSKAKRVNLVSDMHVRRKIRALGKLNPDGTVSFQGSTFLRDDPRYENCAEAVIRQCEDFTGIETGEADVDDYVDTCAQAWQYIRDEGYIDIDTDNDYHLNLSREEEEELAPATQEMESLYG